jgi:isoleucyl-tRNA synthetase
MKQNLKRNIALTFRVDEDERDFIRKKMKKAGIDSLRLYLLKMAVCGQIVTVDMTDMQECVKLLRSISNNVNQLAKKANEGQNVYTADLDHVQERLFEVWAQQDKIIKALTKIVEEVA